MALSSSRLPTSARLMKLHSTHINPLRRQYFTQSSSAHAVWRSTTVIQVVPTCTPRDNADGALQRQTTRLDLLRTPFHLSAVQKRTAHSSQSLSSSIVSGWRQYKGQIVTWTVIAICGGVFIYQQYAREQATKYKNMKPLRFLAENFVLNLSNLRAGRWWTLITYSFMHFAPLHLSFNVFGIMAFGPTVVTYFGTSAFVVGWLGSALSAGGASLWWENRSRKAGKIEAGAVGASGSLFGFLTMIACLTPYRPVSFLFIPISFPMWGTLATTVGLSLVCMAKSWLPFVGHAGHLGGIGFGALYYALLLRRKRILRF